MGNYALTHENANRKGAQRFVNVGAEYKQIPLVVKMSFLCSTSP